jgi:hypothetical protein
MTGDRYEGRGSFAVTGQAQSQKMVQNKPKRRTLEVQKQQKGSVEFRGSAQWTLV